MCMCVCVCVFLWISKITQIKNEVSSETSKNSFFIGLNFSDSTPKIKNLNSQEAPNKKPQQKSS